MSATAIAPRASKPAARSLDHRPNIGPIGRLGRYTATHFRTVLAGWALVAVVLGFFAPRVEKALSGAGWEAGGSQSAQARKLVERDFAGLGSYGLEAVVYSPKQTAGSPAFRSAITRVEQTLRANARCRTVVAPAPGRSISADGHTAIVQAGAARDPNEMVAAADTLQGAAQALRGRRARQPHGCGGDVVRLQRGQPFGDAQVRGHLMAGHARDHAARVRLARRCGVAADADDGRLARCRGLALPRDANHADLDLGDELRADVRACPRDRLRAVPRDALPRRVLRIEAERRGSDRGDNGHGGKGGPVQSASRC